MPLLLQCPPSELLQAAANGVLSQVDAESIRQHVASCSECLTALRKLETGELVSASDATPSLGRPKLQQPVLGWIGPYQIFSVVGSGGMGVVYRARDPQLDRIVALKTVRDDLLTHTGVSQRFLREARAVAAIRHDNIVTLYHVGLHEGTPYFVMPLLEGQSLSARLVHAPPVDVASQLRIATEIAAALDAAHHEEITHRDIKPGNIWLESPFSRVKVLDFGLARTISDERSGTPTFGTPGYMAPEQIRGDEIDHRCDLFSFGAVLYEMAVGRAPFVGSNLRDVMDAIQQSTPLEPHRLNEAVPEAYSRMIMKLLEKDPKNRIQAARETLHELETLRAQWRSAPTVGMAPGEEDIAGLIRDSHKKPLHGGTRIRPAGMIVLAGAALVALGGWAFRSTKDPGGDPPAPPALPAPAVAPEAIVPLTLVPSARYSEHLAAVGAVAFVEPTEVLSAGLDNSLRRWHARTLTTQFAFRGNFSGGRRIVLSNDRRRALLVSLDASIRLCDIEAGGTLKAFKSDAEAYHAAVFLPDERHFLAARSDGDVELWNIDEDNVIGTLSGHRDGVNGVAVAPDGRSAWTAGTDGTVRRWQIDQRRELAAFAGHDGWVMDVVPINGGQEIVTCGLDGKIRILDAIRLTERRCFEGHQRIVRRLAVSADGKRILSASDDGCRLWDLASSRHLATLPSGAKPSEDIAFSPDGRLAATADGDGIVRVWEIPAFTNPARAGE